MQTLTHVVKQALAAKYGFQNVKVHRGRGTAAGWVEASVTIKGKEPTCVACTAAVFGKCYECAEKVRAIRGEAEKIAYDAVHKAGLRFGIYYPDDGYGTARSEFLLDVRFA
jgi:hypothetical protein